LFNLETAVERAWERCPEAGWQGATTRQADARKEEQHRQRAIISPDALPAFGTEPPGVL
jgi:hypothetical protein